MERFINFIDQNKKFLLILSGVILIVFIIDVIFSFLFCSFRSPSSPASITTQSDFLLPQAEQVSAEETPLLYDFTNGCLGYKSHDVDMFKDEVFVLCTKKDFSSVYGVYKPQVAGDESLYINLPFLSNEPVALHLQTEDAKNDFYNYVSNLTEQGKIKKIQEGEYTLYVVPAQLTIDGQSAKVGWHGIDLNKLYSNHQAGRYGRKYLQGEGYSTEMIRACCDLEHIKKVFHYDFNDEFWDTYNFACLLKLHKKDNPDDCLYVTPMVQYDGAAKEAHYTFQSIFYGDNLNLFNDYCKKGGYETPEEAIENPDYEQFNSDAIKALKKHDEDYVIGQHPILTLGTNR